MEQDRRCAGSATQGRFLYFVLFAGALAFTGCESGDDPAVTPITTPIHYTRDGRSVHASDVSPMTVDLNNDGYPEFTVFLQLTAMGGGDRLYAGVNPIGVSQLKSSPPDEDQFLNMGFIIPHAEGTMIDGSLGDAEAWTDEHAILAIRHTPPTGDDWHEGAWADGTEKIVAIRHFLGDDTHLGWLRLRFDKATETLTLVDFAFTKSAGMKLKAGAIPDER